ncbi:unnamed protein product [Lymnaea stagnalis]|uniref:CXC MSL2-type domain-containing protein n=1 Tax=Lymnaea stagnalis TaxID=6523 RepID=A0AAV2H3A1_LYMST
MDAYNFYLSTLRYIMNAKSNDKATWCDIFKYLPCLRQMLSCCVCGSILLRPHGPTHGVCLHHVCQRCVGGRMRLKPSCSWCKDHTNFKENRKLRILIMCFKRLCTYVLSSNLGIEISKASINGYGSEAERTLNVLKEAEQFDDDYVLTPPPSELPTVSKTVSGGKRSSTSNEFYDSTGVADGNVIFKRKRGRPKMNVKPDMKKSNLTEHAKRLKKKALNSRSQNSTKKRLIKSFSKNEHHESYKKTPPSNSGLLISQRPHRHRSGKFSVGQLWRETFLEETQTESYPDSGIEVGNSSDLDHNSHPPSTAKQSGETADPAAKKQDVIRKETRLHKNNDTERNGALSVNDGVEKPRLTLTISTKRFHNNNLKRQFNKSPSPTKTRDLSFRAGAINSLEFLPGQKKLNSKLSAPVNVKSTKQHSDICKCARFKQPNRLTCFGQKCPCYSERRPCVDCLCNGCKNPLKTPDTAPPLMHIIKDVDSLDHSHDRSMPRLSPIPRI